MPLQINPQLLGFVGPAANKKQYRPSYVSCVSRFGLGPVDNGCLKYAAASAQSGAPSLLCFVHLRTMQTDGNPVQARLRVGLQHNFTWTVHDTPCASESMRGCCFSTRWLSVSATKSASSQTRKLGMRACIFLASLLSEAIAEK